ncbi:MAG: GIY-YIG nuclease family protein [Patescibacteria group bacterium]
MSYVYAIASLSRNYIYVGLTNNTERRIGQHQQGKEKTTAPYRPFKTVLIEKYRTRVEAREREKYLKSGEGKELLKRLRD